MMPRWVSKIALAAVSATAAGCALGPVPQPLLPEPPREIAYKRLVIVEFADRTGYGGTARSFTDMLRQKLSACAPSSDVIVVSAQDLGLEQDPFVAGTLPVSTLVAARQKFRADALVIGSVDGYHPYYLPSLQVSAKVIDTANAAIPFEFSGGWDTRDEKLRQAIDLYYRRNIGTDDCRFGPDVFLVSPIYFMKFAASDLAQCIAAKL